MCSFRKIRQIRNDTEIFLLFHTFDITDIPNDTHLYHLIQTSDFISLIGYDRTYLVLS